MVVVVVVLVRVRFKVVAVAAVAAAAVRMKSNSKVVNFSEFNQVPSQGSEAVKPLRRGPRSVQVVSSFVYALELNRKLINLS